MDSDKGRIDPINLQTIRHCLEKQFPDVKFRQDIRPTFTMNDGKPSSLLVVNEEFLAGHKSIEVLQHLIENKVIPKILKNPGKRIQISKLGDITVEEKNLS